MSSKGSRARASAPGTGTSAETATDMPVPGRVIAWLGRWIETAAAEADLSLAQYRMLSLLADGSSAAKALARGLDVSPPTVTALVDGLVERGFVDRKRSATDRRRVDHHLTAAGGAVLGRADAAIDARLAELTGHLGATDKAVAFDGLDRWGQALNVVRDELAAERAP